MNHLVSKIKKCGPVTIPDLGFDYAYMVPFKQKVPLPEPLEKWQITVDDMLRGIQTDAQMFLYVSQANYAKGETIGTLHSHRIFGNWKAFARPQGDQYTLSGSPVYWELMPETILIASSHPNLQVTIGRFAGSAAASGSVEHVDLSGGLKLACNANTCYALCETSVHGFIPVWKKGIHTVVRIHIPNFQLSEINL